MIENKERGITLIALVITIVILIILASVVLVVTIDTGLIGIADESVIKNGIVEVETAYSKYVANLEKDMILSGDYSGKVNMEYLVTQGIFNKYKAPERENVYYILHGKGFEELGLEGDLGKRE